MQSSNDLKQIFENFEGETSIADILNECTSYPISNDDELPKNVCRACRVEALSAFKFKRKCEESYCKLVAFLSERKAERFETGLDKRKDPLKTEELPTATIEPFICHICERQFSLHQHLHRHLTLIHKITKKHYDLKSDDEFEASKSPLEVLNQFDHSEDDDKPLAALQNSEKSSKLQAKADQGTTEKSRKNLLNKIDVSLFPCTKCAKVFKRASFLHKHITARHNTSEKSQKEISQSHPESSDVEKSNKCKICNKSFTTKVYLQRHIEIHKRKRFGCKECSQSFPNKIDLSAHVKAEGHDKPLLCPECGLRCKTSNILMVHLRRHRGEKPFKCKFCSKGFPRMDDLRIHEKYHTNEKNHYCETCGKGFQRKYNLTIHLRVHTREKPFKCQHCPQAFAQSNDLKAHIRRHTGERFRCELCDAAFIQIYQIRQHKLCEHGIREDPPTQRVAKFTSTEAQELQIKQNLQNELRQSIDLKTLEEINVNDELEYTNIPIDINEVASSSEVVHSLVTSDFSNIQSLLPDF